MSRSSSARRSSEEALAEGLARMERKDWRGARELLSTVSAGAGADVHQALAIASFCCGEWDESRVEMEHAFAGFRRTGELRPAVQAATFLGFIYFGRYGDVTASRGWLRRARRICEQLGECVESGYVELAIPACDVPNVTRLERSARRALAIARQFGDPDLEMRAVADLGLALVSQGRVGEGLEMLDEAMTAGTSGEVQFFSAGLIACSMLSGCVRIGDVERAQSWLERIDAYLDGAELTVVESHCKITLGCVLALMGRSEQAEVQLREAIRSCERTSLPLRAWAVGALAELRVRQQRLDEARELLGGYEERLETVAAMAELARADGDHAKAIALVRRGLRELGSDATRGADLLDLLVRVQLDAGDLDGASRSAARLAVRAEQSDSEALHSLATLARERVRRERGMRQDPADLEQSLQAIATLARPMLSARIRLELARQLSAVDPVAARMEAEASLATFERLGAIVEAERARETIEQLTAKATATPAGFEELTRRELEIAELVADGLPNRQIASTLVLSVRTVENHVARVLMKLDLTSRTQLATLVERRRLIA